MKQILSAGILAFYDLPPDQREAYMAKAAGEDIDIKKIEQEAFRKEVKADLVSLGVHLQKSTPPIRASRPRNRAGG